jgi:pimeloyl-ACP methyl ester carboxylesterase
LESVSWSRRALVALLSCVSLGAFAAPPLPVADSGVIAGSPYRIDIPKDWNGSLVVAAHGYVPAGAPVPAQWPRYEFAAPLLARGYAVATAGYRKQGWALAEAVDDAEALREAFVEKYGKPKRTFMIGSSMGGLVTVATAETRADRYDGALSLCGAVAPTEEGLRDRILPLLVAFDYLFPSALAIQLDDPSAPADVSPERLEAALARDAAKAELLAKHFEIKREDLASHLRFYYVMLRELEQRGGGMPVGNRDVVYRGFGDDAAFNEGVKRFSAVASSADYLRAHYTPTGKLARPLMLLHTSYDPTVPPAAALRYLQLAEAAGSAPLVATRTADSEGHCNFSADQVGNAFDALVSWVESGKRPGA